MMRSNRVYRLPGGGPVLHYGVSITGMLTGYTSFELAQGLTRDDIHVSVSDVRGKFADYQLMEQDGTFMVIFSFVGNGSMLSVTVGELQWKVTYEELVASQEGEKR